MKISFLKKALRINAALSVVVGIHLILFNDVITAHMGTFDSNILVLKGIWLSFIGGILFLLAEIIYQDIKLVQAINYFDTCLVVALLVIMIFGAPWLSTIGLEVLGCITLLITTFVYLHSKLIRDMSH